MAKKKLKKKTSKATSSPKINQLADPVLNSARDIVRAGLGALSVAQKEGGKVAGQGASLFEKLVAEGAKLEKEGKQTASDSAATVRKGVTGVREELESKIDAARKQAEDRWDKLETVFEDRVARVMANLGVPSADDLKKLSAQVESLSNRVAELAKQKAAKPAASKAPAKAPAKPAPAKAKAKVTKKPAAKASAKKSATETVFHLVPSDDDWAVRLEGGDKDLSVHGTKREALDAARKAAQAKEPSRLVVHKSDGTIQTSYRYGDAG